MVLVLARYSLIPDFHADKKLAAKLLNLFSFWLAATSQEFVLPPIVSKSLVGFRHAVDIFFFLDGRTTPVGGVQQLIGQLIDHAFFAAATGIAYDPANSQRSAPVGIHLNRDLIVGAAHAAGLDLQQRLGI